jgi:hypothetical protein
VAVSADEGIGLPALVGDGGVTPSRRVMAADPLELLRETLDATAEEDHLQRHELADIRTRAGHAISAAKAVESQVGYLPDEIATRARTLDNLIRRTPEDRQSIADAFAAFRTEVSTFVVLDGSADDIGRRNIGGAAEVVAEARQRAEGAASEVDRLLDATQRLVTRAADDELAKHYRNTANEEASAADRWRMWTITGFAGTLALGAGTAALSIFGDRTLEELIGGATFSLAIGGLTAFLATQSKLHRSRETTFRQAELKLAVVSPMLDAISASGRDALQVEVVRLLFETERPPGATG